MHLENSYNVNEEECSDDDSNNRRVFKSAERSMKKL